MDLRGVRFTGVRSHNLGKIVLVLEQVLMQNRQSLRCVTLGFSFAFGNAPDVIRSLLRLLRVDGPALRLTLRIPFLWAAFAVYDCLRLIRLPRFQLTVDVCRASDTRVEVRDDCGKVLIQAPNQEIGEAVLQRGYSMHWE